MFAFLDTTLRLYSPFMSYQFKLYEQRNFTRRLDIWTLRENFEFQRNVNMSVYIFKYFLKYIFYKLKFFFIF